VQVAAIDMCAIYLAAVRRTRPHAAVAVDLFHAVQLAVKTTGDVRRRAIREKYGRRGRSGNPEYGTKNLLVRNLEHLTGDQFAKIITTLDRDTAGQQNAAAWIAKEKLRDALNLRARITRSAPCEHQVRGRLFSFHDRCAQNEDIPELISLAKTISRWEDEIICAVLTRVTNAAGESPNRGRQTQGGEGIRVPQPGEPAQAGPDRLNPRHPAPLTHRNQTKHTLSNTAATKSRLTSKTR